MLSRPLSRRRFLATTAGTCIGLGAPASRAATEPETVNKMSKEYADLLKRLRTPNKHPERVLEASYEKGAFDALAVDAPFVFAHDGRYYMTHIGFDGIGYRTGLASSTDLLNWTKEGILIDRGPKGSVTEFNVALTWIVRDNELFGSGRLRKVDGRFLGTYHAYPRPGYEEGPACIGLCWSDNLRHWQLAEPILRSSDTDAARWESGGLYKSCLLEHGDSFYLFYNAKTPDSPWIEQTGVAVSHDLKTWKRHNGNPVIPVGPKGSFDDIFCSDPYVLRCGDIWTMFFYTLSSDGRARDTVAFSKDLLSWTKSNEILIDVGPPGAIDAKYAHKPAVIAREGKLYHYYCAVAPAVEKKRGTVQISEVRGIGVATS